MVLQTPKQLVGEARLADNLNSLAIGPRDQLHDSRAATSQTASATPSPTTPARGYESCAMTSSVCCASTPTGRTVAYDVMNHMQELVADHMMHTHQELAHMLGEQHASQSDTRLQLARLREDVAAVPAPQPRIQEALSRRAPPRTRRVLCERLRHGLPAGGSVPKGSQLDRACSICFGAERLCGCVCPAGVGMTSMLLCLLLPAAGCPITARSV